MLSDLADDAMLGWEEFPELDRFEDSDSVGILDNKSNDVQESRCEFLKRRV